ncbi:MAG: hypothetical protein AAGA41_06710 [Pseudomonadota bacterium]
MTPHVLRGLATALVLAGIAAANLAAQVKVINGGLTDDELAAQPDDGDGLYEAAKPPVAFKDAKELVLTPLARGGYSDIQGRLVIDVIENDNAFLAVRIETPDGAPVSGAKATTSLKGTSLVVDSSEALLTTSDDYGIVEIVVLAGQMGLDLLTVQVGDAKTEVVLNVLSLAAAGVPALPEVERGIPWSDLMQARVRYEGGSIAADFPNVISQRAGETVRIAGFMTPLQAENSQRWFLLTSSPPHCYFDIPGGPAGTVEVLAPDGIEVSWEPIIVEGRFEPVELGKGAVYKLHDAKRVEL